MFLGAVFRNEQRDVLGGELLLAAKNHWFLCFCHHYAAHGTQQKCAILFELCVLAQFGRFGE